MPREGRGGQECLWLVAGQGERAGDSRGGGSGGSERPQENRQGFFLFPLFRPLAGTLDQYLSCIEVAPLRKSRKNRDRLIPLVIFPSQPMTLCILKTYFLKKKSLSPVFPSNDVTI